jgi:hypothetical protein
MVAERFDVPHIGSQIASQQANNHFCEAIGLDPE